MLDGQVTCKSCRCSHWQASSILVFRWLADIVFTQLCEWENWQTASE